MHTCFICGNPIRQGHPTSAPRIDGRLAHKICFDIEVASLETDLETTMRAHPDKYKEIRPHIWISKKPPPPKP